MNADSSEAGTSRKGSTRISRMNRQGKSGGVRHEFILTEENEVNEDFFIDDPAVMGESEKGFNHAIWQGIRG